MVRNFGKGGKGCKRMSSSSVDTAKRVLLFKECGQDYAVVKDLLGSGRCKCVCSDGNIERLCIIRGNMRKRSVNRIYKGDLVLVSLREYQDSKADIIHLYNSDESRMLVGYGEITQELLASTSVVSRDLGALEDSALDDIVFEDI